MIEPLGVLGGTFDPVHFGHLRLAQEAAENFALSKVRLVPAGIPPHRGKPQASAKDRLEMVRLACEDNPLLIADGREVAKKTLCYTVETLADLRRELGAEVPLCLLLGADAFLGFHSWHRWRDIFRVAHLVVAHRPGFRLDDGLAPELQEALKTRKAEASALRDAPGGKIFFCEITLLDISATGIRRRIARGASPRYLAPESVLDYIRSNQLYQEPNEDR